MSISVALGSGSIGNGLANGGDRVILKNPGGADVDAMSYGTDTLPASVCRGGATLQGIRWLAFHPTPRYRRRGGVVRPARAPNPGGPGSGPMPTDTATSTPTGSNTSTATPTATPAVIPNETVTAAPTSSSTATETVDPLVPTATPTQTATLDVNSIATQAPTVTQTPSPAPTSTPSRTPTITRTPTSTPTVTAMPSTANPGDVVINEIMQNPRRSPIQTASGSRSTTDRACRSI